MSSAVLEVAVPAGFRLRAVPVLRDNFVYLLEREGKAILIDAGAAEPVLALVRGEGLRLLQVLITHDHADHTGGCLALQEALGVLARSPGVMARGESWLGTSCEVLSTPGHTAVHKSFYFPELGVVCSGDALINGGCGRLLGGTAEELFDSLGRLAALPEETRVLGGHDYLLENLRFAAAEGVAGEAVERRRVRYAVDRGGALFATVAEEVLTNPFMSCGSAVAFAAMRLRKDGF